MSKEPPPPAKVPLDEIRRIVRLMKDNDLTLFQFEREGVQIKLRRGPEPGTYPPPMMPFVGQAAAAAAPPPADADDVKAAPAPAGDEVHSPLVGTFTAPPPPTPRPSSRSAPPSPRGRPSASSRP